MLAGALMGVSSLAVMANSLTLQIQRPISLAQQGAQQGADEAQRHSKPECAENVSVSGISRSLQRHAHKSLV